MTEHQFDAICTFRKAFKKQVQTIKSNLKNAGIFEKLVQLQQKAADIDGVKSYPIDNPLVYNKTLDDITIDDDIRLIVTGDNPGKEEQAACNERYLVGQSGRLAEGFFKKHHELNIDFRKNTIILNKTCIHTAKTKELRFLITQAPPILEEIFIQDQIFFAQQTAILHKALGDNCLFWLIGYTELKPRGIFLPYKKTLLKEYHHPENTDPAYKRVFVYRHFSMNSFLIDLNRAITANTPISDTLQKLGTLHKKEVLEI